MSSELNVQFNLNTTAAEAAAHNIKITIVQAKAEIEKPIKVTVDPGSLATMARSFNDIKQTLTTFAGGISSVITSMAAMSDEQTRLSAQSQRLNLDFDAAAGAAGRFVDETSAMTVATQFAARGINLTQTQLNDLMHVAGATAQTLGTDVAGEANNLAEALIRGRQNSLAPFGAAFTAVSGEAHTVAERLAVLTTRSGEVETATDTAATTMERFKDQIEDAERTFSTAFITGLVRMSTLGETTNQVSTDMAELNTTIAGAGHAVATVLSTLGLGVAGIGAAAAVGVGAVVDLVRIAASATGGVAGMRAEIAHLNQSGLTVRTLSGFQEILNRIRAINSDDGGQAAAAAEQATTTRQAIVQTGEVIEITGAATTARHGHTAATHAETEAQMRAGAEAVRIAEQHRLDAQNGISLTERRERAEELLTAAVNQTTRASEAMEQAHQTPAQRSSLVTALNAETAARHEVAAAIAAQSTAISGLVDEDMRRAAGQRADRDNDQTKQNLDQAAQREADTGRQQAQRLLDAAAQRRTYGGQMRALMKDEVTVNGQLASATMMGFNAMGSALGKHALAFAQGKEDVKDALQGMLKDMLTSIGSEAMVKGAMMMAEGAAALAGIVTAPLAAGNFAAGAAYFGVGALASAAGAAIPPAASSAGGGGGGGASAASAATSETPMRSGGSGMEAPKNITINFSAFQSNEAAQALIVRSLRESGYNGRTAVGSSFSTARR